MRIKVRDKFISIKKESEDGFYTLTAVTEQGEEMGFVTFSIKNVYGTRSVWLCKIKTHEKFQRQGVAQALLWAMEYTAYKNLVRKVIGKYYPENSYAKPFYEKNGYLISKEEDWEVEKTLDFEYIKNNIEPSIENINNLEDREIVK